MDDDARTSRMRQVLADEVQRPLSWWWLSFADQDLPPGEQFLGAAIVQAHGTVSAALVARRRGINPGGEVLSGELSPVMAAWAVSREFANRLLSRVEAEQAKQEMDGLGG